MVLNIQDNLHVTTFSWMMYVKLIFDGINAIIQKHKYLAEKRAEYAVSNFYQEMVDSIYG